MASEQEMDWSAEWKKWKRGINLETALDIEVVRFTKTMIYDWESNNAMDTNLWELVQEYLANFDKDTFALLDTRTLQHLRDCLRSRGVYVAKNNKRLTIAETLLEVINEEQHEWTDADIQEVCGHSIRIKSWRLRERVSFECLEETFHPYKLSPAHATALPVVPAQIPTYNTPDTKDLCRTQPTTVGTTPAETPNYGREIATVAKLYTEEQKYGGVNESFDFKLTIFNDICKRSGLPPAAYVIAFPSMLKGLAQDHTTITNSL
jgi:hypothetical protein